MDTVHSEMDLNESEEASVNLHSDISFEFFAEKKQERSVKEWEVEDIFVFIISGFVLWDASLHQVILKSISYDFFLFLQLSRFQTLFRNWPSQPGSPSQLKRFFLMEYFLHSRLLTNSSPQYLNNFSQSPGKSCSSSIHQPGNRGTGRGLKSCSKSPS